MKENIKELYLSPACEVAGIRQEGFICASYKSDDLPGFTHWS